LFLHSENLSLFIADHKALAAGSPVAYRGGIEPTARRELEVTLAARKELGPEHDDALVAGFVDRIESEIDRRVDERIAQQTPRGRKHSVIHPGNLALAIPIIAIAGGLAGFAGLVLAFAALVTVFLVAELRD
jgi:anti-sigma factor RsiW